MRKICEDNNINYNYSSLAPLNHENIDAYASNGYKGKFDGLNWTNVVMMLVSKQMNNHV